MPSFADLGLSAPLLRALDGAGYQSPTPVQAAAIPAALTGRDLTATAQTGTGKTAAFVLPTLERLVRTGRPAPAAQAGGRGRGPRRDVRALVVTPTRELALQIEENVRIYGAHTGLKSTAIYGGVGMQPQVERLKAGVDVVIATPGRLLDLLGQRALDLSAVEILILDEADRMFDMGFVKDVRRIVAAVPKRRQTLLFSATMPPAIEDLAASIQHDPARVDIGRRTDPAATVTQRVAFVDDKAHKLALLLHVLGGEARTGSVIVFTRTKHGADRVAKRLGREGVAAAPIHGDRSQSQRVKALDGFKSGAVRVLVATDIAARGIDVDGVSHVVNFDTPNIPEDYIHRIGRTGRAEATGDALTFVAPDEQPYLKAIEKTTGRAIARAAFPGFVAPPPREDGAPHAVAATPRHAHVHPHGTSGAARGERPAGDRPTGHRRPGRGRR